MTFQLKYLAVSLEFNKIPQKVDRNRQVGDPELLCVKMMLFVFISQTFV